MKKGRGTDGETATGGRAATVRHVFGERVLSICMPKNKEHPKGWRWVALSDVAQMESGHTPSRNHPEYWGGDIPWISVKDARLAHGKRLYETEEYTNSLGIANSSARLLPAGTVCLSRGGTVGYVVILDRPMATSQGFANWICGPQLIPQFLQYLFLSEADSLEKFSIGTTIKTIYYPDLKAFHVCLPPVDEQKRIVALLDEAFAGIDEAKAITEINQRSAQVLYLNSIRVAFSKNGSGKVRLGEVCRTSSGGTPHKSHKEYYDAGAIPWLRSGEVCQREINNSECFITELGMANSSAKLFPPNTVLVAMYGATAGQVGILRFQSTTNQAVCGILPGAYMPEYLYYYFSSIKDELVAQAVGGAQPNISQEKIRNVLIPKVSNAEQSKVVKQLDGITAHARQLGELFNQKKSQYLSLKESLLAQAFAGELTA
jgi:type I restriction enzyme S subunit